MQPGPNFQFQCFSISAFQHFKRHRPTWEANLILVAACLFTLTLQADSDQCSVCGTRLGAVVYLAQDKVTGEKQRVCQDCLMSRPQCYICGLPLKTSYTELADGRSICARDAATAVLNQEEAKGICRQAKKALDRLFSRLLTFPETNVTVAIVDRMTLQERFKFPGNDYQCPNVWGYVETRVSPFAVLHEITILSALPLAALEATCAHEYAHTWLNENLSDRRRKTLSRDATEGFCELVAFLYMDSEHEEAQKKMILLNAYTRGQIHLFLEAEERYGLSAIVDWVKQGTDDRLDNDDLARVKKLEAPRRAAWLASEPATNEPKPRDLPEVVVLKGIFWTPSRPRALINERTFEVNQEGELRLGSSNVTIRCLAIRENSARIQIVGSGEEQELRFRSDSR